MRTTRFDDLARLFAHRRQNSRLQPATPTPTGASPTFLFVQSYGEAALLVEPTPTLTLHGGPGDTLFFSDRPDRIVGKVPTPRFLDSLGFGPDNPPNAALVAETGDGTQDIFVVELTNPTYDEPTRTATYAIAMLADDDRLDMQLEVSPTARSATYARSHLFIDDCPNAYVWCQSARGNLVAALPRTRGMCWDWSDFSCNPCAARSESAECNATFPACNGQCSATRLLA